MKIIILHGDDSIKSYERLKRFVEVAKKRNWEIVYMDDSLQTIEENLSANSLFGGERFFIIKNIKKFGKKEISWINKKHADLSGNLIIHNDGIIPATLLKNLPKESKIEEFKLPILLWNFLDGLYPGNSNHEVQTLHKIAERLPVEFVFSLIAKHFRDLYWIKTDAESTDFPFWKINKLKSQASKFSDEQLKGLISLLSEIDVKVKTSKADLLSELDLFLIKHLE